MQTILHAHLDPVENSAFLAAIRATPEDDGPRLIYADWLEERGDTERASLIRLHCLLCDPEAEIPGDQGDLLAMAHEQARVITDQATSLAPHALACYLTGRFWVGSQTTQFRWNRGFIDMVETDPATLVFLAEWLRLHDVIKVKLRRCHPERVGTSPFWHWPRGRYDGAPWLLLDHLEQEHFPSESVAREALNQAALEYLKSCPS